MSRTLFWYVFKDLVRIFLLTSGVLAGIMAFGGLLRPLTQHGLDAAQVVRMLGYLMPAMTAYSLPVAALFATSVVYGRMSADNELTACRAAGISFLSMAFPAFVLGLLVAIISLATLCFVVPIFTLKVEKVIYSNLARLVANQIERRHQVKFEQGRTPITVYARSARVLPPNPDRPDEDVVQLHGAMIVTYTRQGRDERRLDLPEDFYLARTATAYIRQPQNEDDVTLTAVLEGGTKLPRNTGHGAGGSIEGGVGTSHFGPIPLPSPVRERTRFMDLFRLKALLEAPEKGRNVQRVLREFVRQDQEEHYLRMLKEQLNGEHQAVVLVSGHERYILARGAEPAEMRGRRLVLSSGQGEPTVRLVQQRGGNLDVLAREIVIRAFPDTSNQRIALTVEMLDADVRVDQTSSPRASFSRPMNVAMPPAIAQLETTRTAAFYTQAHPAGQEQRRELKRQLYRQTNGVVAELHGRAAFSLSCLILVMVGCSLGMMFRSGNFLSAFAVSAIPALLCVALVVSGQHTARNIPYDPLSPDWTNPLQLGVTLIWSGNVIVAVLALALIWRLQRQ